jgi:hypothetical protein
VLVLFLAARPRRSRIKQQFLITFRHVEIPGAIRRCPIQAFCCRSEQDTAVARNVLPHPAVATPCLRTSVLAISSHLQSKGIKRVRNS